MPEEKLQFIISGKGTDARKIAVIAPRIASSDNTHLKKPPIIWLGGFRSDMRATKAEALAAWAAREQRQLIRFDYSGHGESGGDFADGTISRWLEDSLGVIAQLAPQRPLLVGSSMGGWIALLAARKLAVAGPERQPSALVLIAPAVDFTEELMWHAFPEDIRHEIMTNGQWMRPSAYSPEPYPITRALIEDGRKHLLFGMSVITRCPVHILQGMADPDVPYAHALKLMEHLPDEAAVLTLIRDGDHRLSREQDIKLLIETVARAAAATEG